MAAPIRVKRIEEDTAADSLSASQRAMVAAKLATLQVGANQHSEGPSIGEASQLLNVGTKSVGEATGAVLGEVFGLGDDAA